MIHVSLMEAKITESLYIAYHTNKTVLIDLACVPVSRYVVGKREFVVKTCTFIFSFRDYQQTNSKRNFPCIYLAFYIEKRKTAI